MIMDITQAKRDSYAASIRRRQRHIALNDIKKDIHSMLEVEDENEQWRQFVASEGKLIPLVVCLKFDYLTLVLEDIRRCMQRLDAWAPRNIIFAINCVTKYRLDFRQFFLATLQSYEDNKSRSCPLDQQLRDYSCIDDVYFWYWGISLAISQSIPLDCVYRICQYVTVAAAGQMKVRTNICAFLMAVLLDFEMGRNLIECAFEFAANAIGESSCRDLYALVEGLVSKEPKSLLRFKECRDFSKFIELGIKQLSLYHCLKVVVAVLKQEELIDEIKLDYLQISDKLVTLYLGSQTRDGTKKLALLGLHNICQSQIPGMEPFFETLNFDLLYKETPENLMMDFLQFLISVLQHYPTKANLILILTPNTFDIYQQFCIKIQQDYEAHLGELLRDFYHVVEYCVENKVEVGVLEAGVSRMLEKLVQNELNGKSNTQQIGVVECYEQALTVIRAITAADFQ